MGRTLFTSLLLVCLLLTSTRLASASCATDDPTGAKVLAARQQANLTCQCADAPNHGAYVSCVGHVAKTLSSGTNPSLPPSCKSAVIKCAAHSTCGKPNAVTCCLTTIKGTTCNVEADVARCYAKHGGVGNCTSCCDACSASGSGPSCPITTTTTTTTLPFACGPGAGDGSACGTCGSGECWPSCPNSLPLRCIAFNVASGSCGAGPGTNCASDQDCAASPGTICTGGPFNACGGGVRGFCCTPCSPSGAFLDESSAF
jgi:hypothetical protein